MNLLHRRLCSSADWAAKVADRMPRDLADVDLGDDVLEIGPGYGATTAVLVDRVPRLTAVEVDEASAARLAAGYDGRATIVHGDGTALPFDTGRFSAVVCFTMLHHVPSRALQDRLFAEARRVLCPGGVFRGVDSQLSLRFRLLHVGDTMVVVDPRTLPQRLTAAGFDDDPDVGLMPDGRLRFTARAGRAPAGHAAEWSATHVRPGPDGPGVHLGRARAQNQRALARRAPSARAANFAQTTCGSTAAWPTQVP